MSHLWLKKKQLMFDFPDICTFAQMILSILLQFLKEEITQIKQYIELSFFVEV